MTKRALQFILVTALIVCTGIVVAEAQTKTATSTETTENKEETAKIEDLKAKIEERNTTIQKLEEEIGQYKKEVDQIGKQAQTLQTAVRTLDTTQKKLSTDLKATENKIYAASLTIEKLDLEIDEKERKINEMSGSIADIIRTLNETESNTFLETLLKYSKASYFWREVDALGQIQNSAREYTNDLRNLYDELDRSRTEKAKEKNKLVGLKSNLSVQKKLVEENKAEKNQLLVQTKNKESEYQKILNAKIALRDAFQKELTDFESQLNLAVDPASIPKTAAGVLSWPVDKVTITQRFGYTEFAKSVGGVYSSIGHNGIDLAAAVGTKIKSAGDGVIEGTGNTDLVCPGASYGKWILVRHNNGLSTLYAHLSSINVSKGDKVSGGDTIGYSGNTGYSTGPHLHFTLYASQGVQVTTKKSAVCKGSYTMPIADLKAYLNPLSYL